MAIVFQLINYNNNCDESNIVKKSLATAFGEYGYIVTMGPKESDKESDIYISTNAVSNDDVKIILTNEYDITRNDMSYYQTANEYFNIKGDIAAIIITGEITQRTAIMDMNFYFSPMVYVHLFNMIDIHMLTSYLVRRYGGSSKVFYEIGEL